MSKLEVSLPIDDDYFDFKVDELGDLLEEAYMKLGYKNTGRAKVSFAPSSLGYGSGKCARNWFYKFTGNVPQKDDTGVLQISNMENGKETHERIQKIFRAAGILVEPVEEGEEIDLTKPPKEREITLSDPPIRGFVDLIVDWHGPAVGEIKTTKQEEFTLRKAAGEPQDYHLIQLLIYMIVLGMDRGFLLYENKNTGEWLIFPIFMTDANRDMIEDALEWMRIAHKAYKDGELPTRPFEKDSKACTYCPFKKYCWKDKDGVVDLPPLSLDVKR